MPHKIIEVAASKQSYSVAGERVVENQTNKKHKKRALPSEWDSAKSKESRRQRYEDSEDASCWVELTQSEIDKTWSQLANDMEQEVLTRYNIKKEARCKYQGRGKPSRWVYRKERQEETKTQDTRS